MLTDASAVRKSSTTVLHAACVVWGVGVSVSVPCLRLPPTRDLSGYESLE